MAVNWDEFEPAQPVQPEKATTEPADTNWNDFEPVNWSEFSPVDNQAQAATLPVEQPIAEDGYISGAIKKVENTADRWKGIGGGLISMAGDDQAAIENISKPFMDAANEGREPGFFDYYKSAFNAVTSGTLLTSLQKQAIDKESVGGKFLAEMGDTGRKITADANQELAANRVETDSLGVELASDIVGGTIDMLPMLIAGRLGGPTAAGAVFGTQVTGSTYGSSVGEKGRTQGEALNAVKFDLLAEWLPEKFMVIDTLLKPGSSFIKRTINATLGEGAQEALTEILQSSYDDVTLKDMSIKDAIINIDWERVAKAGAIGAGVGFSLAGPAHVLDKMGRPTAYDQAPGEPIIPTHKAAGGIDVMPVTKGGNPVKDTFIDSTGKIHRDTSAVAQPQLTPSTIDMGSLDANANMEAAKAAILGDTSTPAARQGIINEIMGESSQPLVNHAQAQATPAGIVNQATIDKTMVQTDRDMKMAKQSANTVIGIDDDGAPIYAEPYAEATKDIEKPVAQTERPDVATTVQPVAAKSKPSAAKSLSDRQDDLIDEREGYDNRSPMYKAMSAAAGAVWEETRAKQGIIDAVEAGRDDIVDMIVERAKNIAKSASDAVPGVSKDSPKYEAIKKVLAENAKKKQTVAEEIERLARMRREMKAEQKTVPTAPKGIIDTAIAKEIVGIAEDGTPIYEKPFVSKAAKAETDETLPPPASAGVKVLKEEVVEPAKAVAKPEEKLDLDQETKTEKEAVISAKARPKAVVKRKNITDTVPEVLKPQSGDGAQDVAEGWEPLSILPQMVKMGESNRQIYDVAEIEADAKIPYYPYFGGEFEILDSEPEFNNQRTTIERELHQLELWRSSAKSQGGRLLRGGRTGSATTTGMLENWRQYNKGALALAEWANNNPDRWNAYKDRQKEIAKLNIGDEVRVPYSSEENPTGDPTVIVRKNKVNWSLKNGYETKLYPPSVLRPIGNQAEKTKAVEVPPKKKEPAKPATISDNNYKILKGKKISYDVEIEDTGETVKYTEDAGNAMNKVDDRIEKLKALMDCLT